ncbi:MAG: hypothetical protein PHO63_04775 [Bacilli bacterium]|nr:hypothetical protein [Bacilli bacterium]MDD4808801.1 hypothetical protein [Bacilli bacterium]
MENLLLVIIPIILLVSIVALTIGLILKKKRLWIISLIFLLCDLFVIACLFAVFFGYIYSTHTFSLSPDKEYKIIIKGDEPKWAFGSEDIMIYARKNSIFGVFNQKVYKTEISNDGKSLNESNFSIDWIDKNNALIVLRGEEQNDEYLSVTFGKNIKIEQKKLK